MKAIVTVLKGFVLSLALIVSTATVSLADDESFRVYAMESKSTGINVSCASNDPCGKWHVYKMKVVEGPHKGRVFYVASVSEKIKPRWKYKNRKIRVSKIDDADLVELLNTEFVTLD